MPTLIARPTVIEADGNNPKLIEEFVGRVNSRTGAVTKLSLKSPASPAFSLRTLHRDI